MPNLSFTPLISWTSNNSTKIFTQPNNLTSIVKTSLPISPTPSPPNPPIPNHGWSLDDQQLLSYDNRIWIFDTNDLRLRILLNKHDHLLSGHYGQSKTMELVRGDYTWPRVRTFVKDYCKSCTTCARSKTPRHKPYGNLRQLPIPEKPWNS